MFGQRSHGVEIGVAGYLVALGLLLAFGALACGDPDRPSEEPELAVGDLDPTAYERQILRWRERRYERLTAPDGWISLVGLFPLDRDELTFGTDPDADLVFPPVAEERLFGTIERRDAGRFVFEAVPGREILVEGEPVERIETDAAGDGRSLGLDVPPYRFYVIERSGRHYLRVRDLTRVERVPLPEIEFFPVDPSWRIEARFEPYDPRRVLPIPTILETVAESVSPGALVFERDGASHRLDALEAGDELFVIFADDTTGEETYGGGRYLYTELPDDAGRVVVDFNKAYNPPCVFTAYATCPLPPPQNRLDTAVEAGERMVHFLDH